MTSRKPTIKPYSGSPRATANVAVITGFGLAMVGGLAGFTNMLFNMQEENVLFSSHIRTWRDFQAARESLRARPEPRRTFYVSRSAGDHIGIVFNYASDKGCEEVEIDQTTVIDPETAGILKRMNAVANRISCERR